MVGYSSSGSGVLPPESAASKCACGQACMAGKHMHSIRREGVKLLGNATVLVTFIEVEGRSQTVIPQAFMCRSNCISLLVLK